MRFDLLVQEFMRDAIVDKKISIFGADFWRPLVHVEDMADACISAIDASSQLISGQIYNVGNDKENYTKIKLAEIIKEFITDVEIEIIKSKKDPRNYKVSFKKTISESDICIFCVISETAFSALFAANLFSWA